MVETILFLAANIASRQLELEQEHKEISSRLRRGKHSSCLRLESEWAVQPETVVSQLHHYAPTILHFTGHGNSLGLVFSGTASAGDLVDTGLFKQMVAASKRNLKLVVLSACESENSVVALSKIIDTVIGTTSKITQDVAIIFAGAFYESIAAGCSVQEAYDHGIVALNESDHMGEADSFILRSKENIDASKIIFAAPKAADRTYIYKVLAILFILFITVLTGILRLSSECGISWNQTIQNLPGAIVYRVSEKVDVARLRALGHTYRKEGQWKDAVAAFRAGAEKIESLIGTDNLDYAKISENLGLAYLQIGKYEEGKNSIQKSGEVFRTKLPANDVRTITCQINLGAMHAKMEQYFEALPFFEEAISQLQKYHPEEKDLIARTQLNLAAIYFAVGLNSDAFSLIGPATKTLSESSANSLNLVTLNNIIVVFVDLGQVDAAVQLSNILMQFESEWDINDRATFEGTLGCVSEKAGEYDRAEQYFRDAIHDLHGRSGIELARLHANLGHLYIRWRKFEHAKDEAKKAMVVLDNCNSRTSVTAAEVLGIMGFVSLEAEHDSIAATNYYAKELKIREALPFDSLSRFRSLLNYTASAANHQSHLERLKNTAKVERTINEIAKYRIAQIKQPVEILAKHLEKLGESAEANKIRKAFHLRETSATPI